VANERHDRTLGHVAAGYRVSCFVLWRPALLHSDSVTLLEVYPRILIFKGRLHMMRSVAPSRRQPLSDFVAPQVQCKGLQRGGTDDRNARRRLRSAAFPNNDLDQGLWPDSKLRSGHREAPFAAGFGLAIGHETMALRRPSTP
jgi:hypothetical protein